METFGKIIDMLSKFLNIDPYWSIWVLAFIIAFIVWIIFCWDMRILMFKNIPYKKDKK